MQDEDEKLGAALARSGASLHVSGHCHWAHGCYTSHAGGGVPCVVASVCEPHWHTNPHELTAASGTRGDAKDATRGGYNVSYDFGPIVCDLRLREDAGSVGAGLAARARRALSV